MVTLSIDLRDSYATRQDAWLMITRATRPLFLADMKTLVKVFWQTESQTAHAVLTGLLETK
ncbi:hypothetical protein [Bacillus wiedmannii]|uniref:hypothetical protein n=1 Tax=Bacillus wiedmannii TaxID=1890302 RepID=UPI003D1E46DB